MNDRGAPINMHIHPDDEMFLTTRAVTATDGLATAVYLKQGAEINATVQQLLDWRFGDKKDSVKILDFACGYGRATRFLVRDIPPSNVWVSDIYADAVRFQKETFAVNGFVSHHDPSTVRCDEDFDMIFVASLFTHLPHERFIGWLWRLLQMLRPNGILAFSVHDQVLAESLRMPPSGILFREASESRTLNKKEYGVTYVTETFVQRAIDLAAGSKHPYRRLVRALCGAHDVYVVPANADEQFRDFQYVQPPVGYVDWFEVSEAGVLRIGGWAGDPTPDSELEAVRVSINGRTVMSSKPTLPRDDVAKVLGMSKYANSGWDCELPFHASMLNSDDLIEVEAISSTGVSTLLHVSFLSAAYQKP